MNKDSSDNLLWRSWNDLEATLRKYKTTYFIGRQIRKFKYFLIYQVFFNLSRILRDKRIYTNSPYEKIKEIRDKHKGERCFIVATGPSLTVNDLELLKNEVTLSMNSICLAFNETNWRPTYYGIQDINVFNKLKNEIEKLDVEYKFIGSNISKQVNSIEDYCVFPINMLGHMVSHKKYYSKFSDDAFSVVYSGYSITYSLMQLAVYMGFEEIYLIGADCNYGQDMKHHFKEYGHVDPSFTLAREQMIIAYKVAKAYAEEHSVKIYNATRGGMLEVFERVNLDEVLSEVSEGETDVYVNNY